MAGHESSSLFCNGYYSEIVVVSLATLDVLFCLTSRVHTDWISAMHVFRTRNEDVVVGLSVSGVAKVWTLGGNESRSSEPIYENESKQIRCLKALSMVCCKWNPRTSLVVCAKSWHVFDASDFSLICSVAPPVGRRWTGGDFLSTERILLWTDCGRSFLYQLPSM